MIKRICLLAVIGLLVSVKCLTAQQNLLLSPELGKLYVMSADWNLGYMKVRVGEEVAKNAKISMQFYMTPELLNAAGNYEVTCQLKHLSVTSDNWGDTIRFDSDKTMADYEKENINLSKHRRLIEMTTVFTANTFTIELSKTGKIIDFDATNIIKGFMGPQAANTEQMEEYTKHLKTSYGRVLMYMFNQFTGYNTERRLKAGDVWTETGIDSVYSFKVKNNETVTVSTVTENTTVINAKNSMLVDIEGKEDINCEKTGEVTVNNTTGLMEKGIFVFKAVEPLSKEKAKTEKPETITITVNASIKQAN